MTRSPLIQVPADDVFVGDVLHVKRDRLSDAKWEFDLPLDDMAPIRFRVAAISTGSIVDEVLDSDFDPDEVALDLVGLGNVEGRRLTVSFAPTDLLTVENAE